MILIFFYKHPTLHDRNLVRLSKPLCGIIIIILVFSKKTKTLHLSTKGVGEALDLPFGIKDAFRLDEKVLVSS